jgi:hypothetical protein
MVATGQHDITSLETVLFIRNLKGNDSEATNRNWSADLRGQVGLASLLAGPSLQNYSTKGMWWNVLLYCIAMNIAVLTRSFYKVQISSFCQLHLGPALSSCNHDTCFFRSFNCWSMSLAGRWILKCIKWLSALIALQGNNKFCPLPFKYSSVYSFHYS